MECRLFIYHRVYIIKEWNDYQSSDYKYFNDYKGMECRFSIKYQVECNTTILLY